MKDIIIYTLVHFCIACTFWLLLLVVGLGYGFQDDLSILEQTFSLVVIWSVHILTFPVWWLTLQELPVWFAYALIPIQILSSFVQVNLLVLFFNLYNKRDDNKR